MKSAHFYSAVCLFMGIIIGFAMLRLSMDMSMAEPLRSGGNAVYGPDSFSANPFLIHSAVGFSFICTFLIAIISILHNMIRKRTG